MDRRATVLYVGKDPRLQEFYKESDFTVLNETDYFQIALSRVAQAAPDIAVIDQVESPKDTCHLYQKLRDMQPSSLLPIILVAEDSNALFRAKCLELGADDVLARPVNPVELLASMRALLRKRQAFQDVAGQAAGTRLEYESLNQEHTQTEHQKVGLADDLVKAEQVKVFFRNVTLLDPAKIFEVVRAQLPDLLEVELFSLFLFDPDKASLELAVHNHPNLPGHLVVPRQGGGRMFELITRTNAVHLQNAAGEEAGPRSKYKHEDALIVPLRIEGEVVGILNLNNSRKGYFTEQDRLVADQVGHFLSTTVSNARLYQKVKALSTLDGLTGLLNHIHLHRRLYVELLRALRYGRPLTCIMLDLDHFKAINDRYGHQAGDRVLKQVAEIIQGNVREVDIPSRYGGEEFFIILPETSLEEARRLAGKLRDAIAQHSFEASGVVIKVTASLGIATFPQAKIMHKNELIRQADQALYYAKRKGRNRVCVYQERRVAQRYRVDMSIRYLTEEVKTLRAAVLNNISASGTSVAVYDPLPTGTPVWMELKGSLNGNGTAGREHAAEPPSPAVMNVKGSVVWCRPSNEVSGLYDVGIEFDGLEEAKKKTLTKLVYTALAKDVTQTIGLNA